MKSIDEARLEDDLAYRYEYLAEFSGFDDQDVKAIHGSAGHLAPLIPSIVETTYEKLLSYNATARHFLAPQHGCPGPAAASLESLSLDDPQIQFRKEHLTRYLMHLLGHAYNEKMAAFLDMSGKMHTPKAGNSNIDVPLVQMNALMGLLSDTLYKTIMGLTMDEQAKSRLLLAFNKLLWIQNDLISRHYQDSRSA